MHYQVREVPAAMEKVDKQAKNKSEFWVEIECIGNLK